MKFEDLVALRDEADYRAALTAIRPYFQSEPEVGSSGADVFDRLALLIDRYEAAHWDFSSRQAHP